MEHKGLLRAVKIGMGGIGSNDAGISFLKLHLFPAHTDHALTSDAVEQVGVGQGVLLAAFPRVEQ